MSMLSSPSNNMFQSLPTTMTAIQGRRGKEAETAKDAAAVGHGIWPQAEDLEARRAENAIDNARQEQAARDLRSRTPAAPGTALPTTQP